MKRVGAASDDMATVMHSPSVTIEIPSVVARVGLDCSLRGGDSRLNAVAACRTHNSANANRTFEQMHRYHGWTLRRVPSVPSRSALVAAGPPSPHPCWEPFLAKT